MPLKPGKAASPSFLNSNSQDILEDLNYTKEDVQHIIDWVKRTSSLSLTFLPILTSLLLLAPLPFVSTPLTMTGHVETTWHSLGTCSMAPREGNSIVRHGVLDERLNVHGVRGLKVADLSICPDNVGCNTYSTALLIGEKCAVLTAEDLGYEGDALDMKVPPYHAPREVVGLSRL
jgi:alcohol oxidase